MRPFSSLLCIPFRLPKSRSGACHRFSNIQGADWKSPTRNRRWANEHELIQLFPLHKMPPRYSRMVPIYLHSTGCTHRSFSAYSWVGKRAFRREFHFRSLWRSPSEAVRMWAARYNVSMCIAVLLHTICTDQRTSVCGRAERKSTSIKCCVSYVLKILWNIFFLFFNLYN